MELILNHGLSRIVANINHLTVGREQWPDHSVGHLMGPNV